MKINDYASDLTRRESGKKEIDVAQVSEILKRVNADLWGIPYFLIRLKRHRGLACCALIAVLALSGCADTGPGSYVVERKFTRLDSAGREKESSRAYTGQFKSLEDSIQSTEIIFRENEPTARNVIAKAKKIS